MSFRIFTLHRRPPSRYNHVAPGPFRSQPAYPTNRRAPFLAGQFSLPARYFVIEANLNGKNPTFDAGFAAASASRNPKPVVITFRTSPSIALQMSALKITGPYVYCPQALLMRTPRLAPHSMSKAFCAETMICRRIDRTGLRRSDPNYLDVCPPVMRR